jgi:heptosyltransferase II
MKTVAILQTAFIGDVVLALPLFESARRSRPGAVIVGVVRPGCGNILENNPDVDEIVIWDKHGRDRGMPGIYRVAKRLSALGVETALVPHRSFRTGMMAFLSGAGERIGFSKGSGALFHSVRVPWRPGMHEVERNLELARAAGWICDGLRPRIYPDDRDRSIVDVVLSGIGRFGVLAPGSVWETKMWPEESYIAVGGHFSRRGLRVLISGGPDDRERCARIASEIPGAIDVCGRLTLRQSAELYRRADFLLTGDTAPQHLAAAMDARVFSIFGPTTREFGFWPYTPKGVVIEEAVSCRPCGVHGHRSCPNRTHLCMRRITDSTVIRIIEDTVK